MVLGHFGYCWWSLSPSRIHLVGRTIPRKTKLTRHRVHRVSHVQLGAVGMQDIVGMAQHSVALATAPRTVIESRTAIQAGAPSGLPWRPVH